MDYFGKIIQFKLNVTKDSNINSIVEIKFILEEEIGKWIFYIYIYYEGYRIFNWEKEKYVYINILSV